MGRAPTTGWTWTGLCAALLGAVILLSTPPEAHAQASLFPHMVRPPANPTAQTARKLALTADLEREVECLALNVYFEARGEPVAGRYAVAAVTLNRVASPDFPHSICQVVLQGAQAGSRACQFSWACDRHSNRPRDGVAWREAQQVAYDVLFYDQPDPTDGALYFHATRVRPSWSRTMTRVTQIGQHVYYRQPETAEASSSPRL